MHYLFAAVNVSMGIRSYTRPLAWLIDTGGAVMIFVKRLLLDVLKPHQPNALEFAKTITATGDDYWVCVTVLEVDEQTETLQLEVRGKSIDFEMIRETITQQGGSVHSIDEVVVQSEAEATVE